jgi:hypothetical protein
MWDSTNLTHKPIGPFTIPGLRAISKTPDHAIAGVAKQHDGRSPGFQAGGKERRKKKAFRPGLPNPDPRRRRNAESPSVSTLGSAARFTPKNCQGFRVRTKVMTLEKKPLPRQSTATKLAQLDAELGILNL